MKRLGEADDFGPVRRLPLLAPRGYVTAQNVTVDGGLVEGVVVVLPTAPRNDR